MPKNYLLEILGEIKGLREDIKSVLQAPLPSKPVESNTPKVEPELKGPTLPVPLEFEEEKKKILNQDFTLEIGYPGDGRPVFEFSVLVPEKYTNMNPAQKEATRGIDRRLKVIENALGLNGVRSWLEIVYKNFNSETQARITADRI